MINIYALSMLTRFKEQRQEHKNQSSYFITMRMRRREHKYNIKNYLKE